MATISLVYIPSPIILKKAIGTVFFRIILGEPTERLF